MYQIFLLMNSLRHSSSHTLIFSEKQSFFFAWLSRSNKNLNRPGSYKNKDLPCDSKSRPVVEGLLLIRNQRSKNFCRFPYFLALEKNFCKKNFCEHDDQRLIFFGHPVPSKFSYFLRLSVCSLRRENGILCSERLLAQDLLIRVWEKFGWFY